jgi:hypothetical protein
MDTRKSINLLFVGKLNFESQIQLLLANIKL